MIAFISIVLNIYRKLSWFIFINKDYASMHLGRYHCTKASNILYEVIGKYSHQKLKKRHVSMFNMRTITMHNFIYFLHVNKSWDLESGIYVFSALTR